jgi:hypothetical protein
LDSSAVCPYLINGVMLYIGGVRGNVVSMCTLPHTHSALGKEHRRFHTVPVIFLRFVNTTANNGK